MNSEVERLQKQKFDQFVEKAKKFFKEDGFIYPVLCLFWVRGDQIVNHEMFDMRFGDAEEKQETFEKIKNKIKESLVDFTIFATQAMVGTGNMDNDNISFEDFKAIVAGEKEPPEIATAPCIVVISESYDKNLMWSAVIDQKGRKILKEIELGSDEAKNVHMSFANLDLFEQGAKYEIW